MNRLVWYVCVFAMLTLAGVGCGSMANDDIVATQVSLALRTAVVPTVSSSPAATPADTNVAATNPPGQPGELVVSAASGPSRGEPFRIGAVLSLSGVASSLGLPERDTLLMLQEQVNQAGGVTGPDGQQRPIELLIGDDGSDENQAVVIARELLERDVVAIIGPTTTAASLAIIPLVTEAQVPMVSLAGSAAVVEPVGERFWVFKTAQNDRLIIEVLVNELRSRGLRDVAFLHSNNAFGNTGRDEFARAAQANGLNVVYTGQYELDAPDTNQQIIEAQNSAPQAIINWAVSPPSAVVTKSFVDQGMTMPLYQSHGIGNQAYIELAGSASERVRFVGGKLLVAPGLLDNDPQKQLLLEYTQQYTQRYNAPISTFGGHAYDAFIIIQQALGRSGDDPGALRDAIEQTTNLVGIGGIFNMSPSDHSGLDSRGLAVIEIRDGAWQVRLRGGSRG